MSHLFRRLCARWPRAALRARGFSTADGRLYATTRGRGVVLVTAMLASPGA